jgi:hypothetical protein
MGNIKKGGEIMNNLGKSVDEWEKEGKTNAGKCGIVVSWIGGLKMKQIEITQEQIKQFKQAFEEFKKAITIWWERIKKAVRYVYGLLQKLPGYKRKVKIKQLQYYQSISLGKTNNWRRNHGLAPLRI